MWHFVVWYKCMDISEEHTFLHHNVNFTKASACESQQPYEICRYNNVDSGSRGNWSRMIFPTDQQFLIQITSAPPKAKIASGPARLHVQDQRFCITTGVPPRLIGFWQIGQLRWVSVTGISVLRQLWNLQDNTYVLWLQKWKKMWTEWERNLRYIVRLLSLNLFWYKNLSNVGCLENISELFVL